MEPITIYSSDHCGYCTAAKRLLEQKDMKYSEINVSHDPDKRQEMMDKSHQRSVPQIFFGDKHIGGYTDLVAYFKQAKS